MYIEKFFNVCVSIVVGVVAVYLFMFECVSQAMETVSCQ